MNHADRHDHAAGRPEEIFARLARVKDPELDEPVTELDFVTGIDVDATGGVAIGFRLPTYWCAANFAFMMADDMRREVAALPWVSRVQVTLGDHMYAETINRGIAEGLSFHESFGTDAAGDLDDLRRTFQVKAFQRRQEALLRHLLDADLPPTTLTVAELQALALNSDGEHLRTRYLDRREVAGPPAPDVPAFVAVDGAPLTAAELPTYLAALRRIGINAEFNGALCRGLLAARFSESCSAPAKEPTLLDFARMKRREDRLAAG